MTNYKKINELIENPGVSPLPLEVIPNFMGINLSSVEAISWQETPNGELTYLTIHFLPTDNEKFFSNHIRDNYSNIDLLPV